MPHTFLLLACFRSWLSFSENRLVFVLHSSVFSNRLGSSFISLVWFLLHGFVYNHCLGVLFFWDTLPSIPVFHLRRAFWFSISSKVRNPCLSPQFLSWFVVLATIGFSGSHAPSLLWQHVNQEGEGEFLYSLYQQKIYSTNDMCNMVDK